MSDSFFTPVVNLNLDFDKKKVCYEPINLYIAKYVSSAKISIIIPRTVNTKLLVRPNFNKYFVMRVNGYEAQLQECCRFFSSGTLTSVNLEDNQLLEVIILPRRIESDSITNSEICSFEVV